MLEVLVHLELEQAGLPPTYSLLRVGLPSRLRIPALSPPPGEAWKQDHSVSRQLGDRWLAERRTALARVPSAILPNTSNYLLNPGHPDAQRLQIFDITRAEFDLRLLHHLRD